MSDDLSKIFHDTKSVEKKKHEPVLDYENNPGYRPKYTIKDLNEFRWSREKIGNLIIKKMTTSGGTDVDWLIEHHGGFIFFEVKRIWGENIVIRKAQMWLYEELKKQLKNCYVFFLAHEGIDFTNPNDYVRVCELDQLLNDPALQETTAEDYEYENEVGFKIKVSFMDEKTVDELREKIDEIWMKFNKLKVQRDKPKSTMSEAGKT